MDIVFCDNHILVVGKPAGLATQPSIDNPDSIEQQAKAWIKQAFLKPGDVFLHAIHRLDKPVSGLVIFARTSKALSRLNASMRAHGFKKTYLAVVDGKIADSQGTLAHYLIHGDYKALVATPSCQGAKSCRLHFKVLERLPHYTIVEIDLETGRYHQIRAQFAAFGHPISGDVKYGGRAGQMPTGQIALHQGCIRFPHPISQEEMMFSIDPIWDRSLFV